MTFKKLIPFLVIACSAGWVNADEVQIADTGITFEAPEGFEVLGDEVIAAKWPSSQKPKWVVGNEGATTTIAYDLKPNDISAAPMDALLEQFEGLFERMVPGVEWIETDVIELDDREWVFLEFTSNAVDTDIHNIMLATSHGKEMLVFNFNSTKEEFDQYSEELRTSVQSIDIP